jgi:hypothetical protein
LGNPRLRVGGEFKSLKSERKKNHRVGKTYEGDLELFKGVRWVDKGNVSSLAVEDLVSVFALFTLLFRLTLTTLRFHRRTRCSLA